MKYGIFKQNLSLMNVSNFSMQLEEIRIFQIRWDKEFGLHCCREIRKQSFISENQHYKLNILTHKTAFLKANSIQGTKLFKKLFLYDHIKQQILQFQFQMKQTLVIFSIIFLALADPLIKNKYLISNPEIRHHYSIVQENIREQLEKQNEKIMLSMQKMENKKQPPSSLPSVGQNQGTHSFAWGQEKSTNDFNQAKPQPVLITPAKPKEITIKPMIPLKKIQFQDKVSQLTLKQTKTYKLYNINDQSVLDLDGNIESIQLKETRNKKEGSENFFESFVQTIKKPILVAPQEKLNLKKVIYEKQQKHANPKKPQNTESKIIPQEKIILSQEESGSLTWIILIIFMLSALLVLFGYTPEDKGNGISIDSRDDQQFNLK